MRRDNAFARAWLVAALASASGCTFLVDRDGKQCSSDADCDHFEGGLTCQSGVCSEFGPRDCFEGTPTTQLEYLNACSRSSNVSFDNCGKIGVCDETAELPKNSTPMTGKSMSLTNPPPEPTGLCSDGVAPDHVIYMLGAADFGPLMRAVQPLLSAEPTPYRAVFQNSSSCAGVTAIFNSSSMSNPSNPMLGGWAFYFDSNGVQRNCRLPDGGVPIAIGVSDLYAETCNASFHAGGDVAEYFGPVVPFVLSVPTMSSEQSISVAALHMVFGLGGNAPAESGLKNTPWNDYHNFSIRNSGAASTVLTALLANVPADKFWGIDRLSTDNLRDSLLAAPKSALNSSIGILSVDYNDKNRGNLRALYLQSPGQKSGYQPDSGPSATDKANVRDGHYPLWGYVHFFTSSNGGSGVSDAARAMVLKFNVPKLNQDLLDDIIDASLIPACAMKVTRTQEIGDFSPQKDLQCGCYFDSRTRKTDCAQCSTSADCGNKQECNYGYCEEVSH